MSNKDSGAVCEYCLYFEKEFAECRKYAPRRCISSKEDRNWAVVECKDWCDEFVENP